MMTDIFSLEALLAAVRQGWQPKYLFFWGHTPFTKQAVDKACLSQWYEARFEVDGFVYPTAEHFMMAEKARLFQDNQKFHEILKAAHPGEAKKLGRLVTGFEEQVWQEHRFEIVVRGNLAKFAQNPQLGEFLQNSQNRVLVEASPRDQVWGIGLEEKDSRVMNPEEWRGQNLLGFALMKARATLAD